MILCLTYHKVCAQPAPEFYTIPPEQLEKHLSWLATSSHVALTHADLVSQRKPAGGAQLLTFDDGTEDHYEIVLPILTRFQRQAVFFVPTARINRPGHLSREKILQLKKAGHTIGFHGHEHRRLDWMTEEDIRVQLELSQNVIGEIIGEKPLVFAPPGGFINRRLREIALELGVRVIRTMRWGYNPLPDFMDLECMPINRHLTDAEFRRAMEFRRLAPMYYAKQIAKKLLPSQVYTALREGVFGLVRRS